MPPRNSQQFMSCYPSLLHLWFFRAKMQRVWCPHHHCFPDCCERRLYHRHLHLCWIIVIITFIVVPWEDGWECLITGYHDDRFWFTYKIKDRLSQEWLTASDKQTYQSTWVSEWMNILTVCFGQVIGVSSQFVDLTSIRCGFRQYAGHKLPLQLGGGVAHQESTQSVEVLFFFLAARRTSLTTTRALLARTASSTSSTKLELFVKQGWQCRHQCLHFVFDITCIIATVEDWLTFITVTELN